MYPMASMLRYDSVTPFQEHRVTTTARRPAQVNDLDLDNWQQYDDILTDSLWVLDARDSSGAHQADYHGGREASSASSSLSSSSSSFSSS